ncbi:uncharacterized protein N7515_001780 [Penicillium bovifimosum]|uniref:Uncharacterized protein n=1 Tax=Penicillium bovifimosum TaxID=126998 RepID=A0A9W9HAK7_9EURO|nr:uncharacterized protein N7515_001780 [Penicillium bovifimosum]KAJ5142993.1 hypothetical protein N7515_001780 [Penicillium bovifimosum]
MKRHWRVTHGRSGASRKGRPRNDLTDANGHKFDELTSKVAYQQVLAQDTGSHYVLIENYELPDPAAEVAREAGQRQAGLNILQTLYQQHKQPVSVEHPPMVSSHWPASVVVTGCLCCWYNVWSMFNPAWR